MASGRRLIQGITALTVTTLLAGVGGVAWAASRTVTNERAVSDAETVSVRLAPAAGGEELSEEVRLIRVGNAVVFARCVAAVDPFGIAVGVVSGVINNGTDPILVVTPGGDPTVPGGNQTWLEPGQRDAIFWAGQVAGADIGNEHGDVVPFTILDQGGTSATGILSWSGVADQSAGTGHCTFSAQARG